MIRRRMHACLTNEKAPLQSRESDDVLQLANTLLCTPCPRRQDWAPAPHENHVIIDPWRITWAFRYSYCNPCGQGLFFVGLRLQNLRHQGWRTAAAAGGALSRLVLGSN